MTSTAVTLRKIAPSAFLPVLVYEIGNGAIAPVIALTALDDGASPRTAGFILALLGIGQVLGDVPASALADRVGDRNAMMTAAGVAVLGQLACLLAPDFLLLGLSLLVIGACNSTFYLARQSYLIDAVPLGVRARAMSTLGGAHRVGLFIGPFLGAAAIGLTSLRAAYVVAMVAAGSTALLLRLIPDVELAVATTPVARGDSSVAQAIRTHWRLFATLGFAVLAVGGVRAARQTVLPLWAEHLGLSAEKTSLIFGIASIFDMALFYPAGKVMDHFGRLSIAIPSMVVLGGAMTVLPLTDSALTLTIVAIVLSAGNGIGSGLMLTLGSDAAPVIGRTQFLSLWRLMADSGNAAGPAAVSVVASIWTLAAGIVAVGSFGLLAAVGLAIWTPRYTAYATIAMARAHRRAEVSRAG